MDIATVVGIVAGFGLIVVSILMGGVPGIFVNIPSIIIVFGGTLASTLINYPLREVLGVLGPIRNAFFHEERDPADLIKKLVEFATLRPSGVLELFLSSCSCSPRWTIPPSLAPAWRFPS